MFRSSIRPMRDAWKQLKYVPTLPSPHPLNHLILSISTSSPSSHIISSPSPHPPHILILFISSSSPSAHPLHLDILPIFLSSPHPLHLHIHAKCCRLCRIHSPCPHPLTLRCSNKQECPLTKNLQFFSGENRDVFYQTRESVLVIYFLFTLLTRKNKTVCRYLIYFLFYHTWFLGEVCVFIYLIRH